MGSGKSNGGLINNTHNDTTRTKWLLSSYAVENYAEALQDLTGVTTGKWFVQHRDVKASRKIENSLPLRNFYRFLQYRNSFNVTVKKLINITIGVIAIDDINVDWTVDIELKIVSGLDNKKLSEISFKRKN